MSWFDNPLISEMRGSPEITYRYLSETRRRFFVGDLAAMTSEKPSIGDAPGGLTVVEVALRPTGKNAMGEGSLLMAAEAVVQVETDSRPFEISVFRHPNYATLTYVQKDYVRKFGECESYQGTILRWAANHTQYWPAQMVDLLKRVVNGCTTYTVHCPIIRRTTTIPYNPAGIYPSADVKNATVAAASLPIAPTGAGGYWWIKIPDRITRVGLSWSRVEEWDSEPAIPGLSQLTGTTVGEW